VDAKATLLIRVLPRPIWMARPSPPPRTTRIATMMVVVSIKHVRPEMHSKVDHRISTVIRLSSVGDAVVKVTRPNHAMPSLALMGHPLLLLAHFANQCRKEKLQFRNVTDVDVKDISSIHVMPKPLWMACPSPPRRHTTSRITTMMVAVSIQRVQSEAYHHHRINIVLRLPPSVHDAVEKVTMPHHALPSLAWMGHPSLLQGDHHSRSMPSHGRETVMIDRLILIHGKEQAS